MPPTRPGDLYGTKASIPNAGKELSGDRGLMVDMFWAEQPKMIWSAALKKESVQEDFLNNHNEMAQIVAHKLKLDRETD